MSDFSVYRASWLGKPYYSIDAYCKSTYGEKLYKIALNAGLSCPNRDGTIGIGGCIFCSAGGSGDFAIPLDRLHDKMEPGKKYIAYFQAYTNTYAPVSDLEQIYVQALQEEQVVGISIATRPDCLPSSVIALFERLKLLYPEKFIWVELGLQTINEKTAKLIRRGYSLPVFEKSLLNLHSIGIPVIVHVILGLPGESHAEMLDTIKYLNQFPIWGIKLQLLHIMKNTDLGFMYENDPNLCCSFETMEEYLDLLVDCLSHLRSDIVVHRVTGDAPKEALLYPKWSADKRRVLNSLHQLMKRKEIYQGKEDPLCTTP